MSNFFSTIHEFVYFPHNCLFCQNKLKIVLTNFIGIKPTGHPLLNSKLKNNSFNFFIHYDDLSISSVEGSIDINSNILSLNSNDNWETNVAIESFKKISPHLEAYCSNRQCKAQHKYCISTEVFLIDKYLITNKFKIRPFHVYMESFNVKNLWVQNDLYNQKLNIFNRDKPEVNPLKFDIINFKELEKDKIINKILMMSIFS